MVITGLRKKLKPIVYPHQQTSRFCSALQVGSDLDLAYKYPPFDGSDVMRWMKLRFEQVRIKSMKKSLVTYVKPDLAWMLTLRKCWPCVNADLAWMRERKRGANKIYAKSETSPYAVLTSRSKNIFYLQIYPLLWQNFPYCDKASLIVTNLPTWNVKVNPQKTFCFENVR